MDRTALLAHVEAMLQAPRDANVDDASALLARVRAQMFGVAPVEPRFGRYHVRGPLGAGGVGVVLRAHDEQLGRDVAIKLVREHGGMPTELAQLRLLREARAIARLSHPNVVAVYDVGRLDTAVHGPGVYVVMELVEGEDLAQWLTTPRSVAEILDAYLAAGRGLAAAHEHGLLHRDFKPHNVLRGRDGRVRVADFGLTRASDGLVIAETTDPAAVVSLTADGAIVGTPLYMAPEQHRGAPVDARADQYAYCFALREALWGRPKLGELAALVAFKHVAPTLPPRRGVPRAIARAIERGLHPDPDSRWPSMHALLAALAAGRQGRMRQGVVVAIAALVGAVILARPTSSAGDGPCAVEDPGWSNVWSADARDEIRAAFERASPTIAAAAVSTIDERLAARGREWTAARDRICGSMDPRPAALECLVGRRAAALALVQHWREADAETAMRAADAASTIADPSECEPQHGNVAPMPADPAVVEIDALVATGRINDAAAQARALDARLATMTGAPAAWAGLSVGIALDEAGDYEAAHTVLARAFDEAQVVDDHAASVRIAARLVSVVGTHLGRTDDADLWARHAWAALARAGDVAPLRAEVLRHLGHLAGARGRWDRALEHYEANADALLASEGADSLAYARALDNVANARIHLGDHAGAIALLRRVLELVVARAGDRHPHVAVTRHNLSAALLGDQRLAAAEAECRAALASWRDTYGERHPDVALARYSLGSILLTAGKADEAVTELEAALALRRELLGDEHSDTLGTMTNLANALDEADRPAEALAVLEPVVRIHDRPGSDRPDRGVTLLNYGNFLRRTGEPARAREVHLQTIDVLATELGADHVATGVTWYGLALDEQALGDLEAARASIERSIDVLRVALPPEHPRWQGVLQLQAELARAPGAAP